MTPATNDRFEEWWRESSPAQHQEWVERKRVEYRRLVMALRQGYQILRLNQEIMGILDEGYVTQLEIPGDGWSNW